MALRIVRHGTVDSTSERAFAALAEGSARDGDVHVAEAQTAGRGRLGRRWMSAPGEGLTLSAVLLPGSLVPHPAAWTMAAGLAVLETVHGLGLRSATLKWPNDVLVGPAKLAGILVEARGSEPPHVVVGMGINVRQQGFPAELEAERAVTSLAREGLACTPDDVLHALLDPLERRLRAVPGEAARLAAEYADALALVGRPVRLTDAAGEHHGVLRTLALDGVVLERPQGPHRVRLEHVTALAGETASRS
jgi:BirA family biotin operon repressor/biotin-[acetyl-CoA-carboxylase] ligase